MTGYRITVPTVLHFYTLSEIVTTTACIQAHKTKARRVFLIPNAFIIYIHTEPGCWHPHQALHFNNADSELSQNRRVQNY